MQFTIEMLPIVLAVLLWAIYHYYKDRHLPEPISYYLLCLGLGAVAAGTSQFAYEALELVGLRRDALLLAETDLPALFLYAVLAIGPIEELAKFLPFLLVLRFEEFNDELDGIIYASVIALGFAAVENWNYVAYGTPLESAMRAFAAPLVHIGFATIWGHCVGVAFLRNQSVLVSATLSVLAAAAIHGLYDFLVIAFPVTALPLATAIVGILWIWRLFLMQSIEHRVSQE